MTVRREARWAFVVALLVVAGPTPTEAHRLDEYLQASRISLGVDAVNVELDLTPGAAVASKVFAWMDTDRDGLLSAAERQAYATLVVTSVVLEVDRRSVPLLLLESQFPSRDEMAAGLGTIRLKARADVGAGSAGQHELHYFNIHQPESSAFLINAITPPAGIQITGQERDFFQHELRLNYTIAPEGSGSLVVQWALAGGATLLMALVWILLQRKSDRSSAVV